MASDSIKVVLDTNVLLVSISSKSKYHWIFQELLKGSFDLFVTNEILTEYEEIISSKFNDLVAKNVVRTLLLLPNVYEINIYYKWNLISADEDDNKFVDCAIAGNVHFIITHDRHFNILKNIEFPKMEVYNTDEFALILQKSTDC